MEVVDRISVSPTGAAGPFKQDAPIAPVIIQKVELLADQSAPAAPAPATAPAATPAPGEAPPAGNTPPPAESVPPQGSPPPQ